MPSKVDPVVQLGTEIPGYELLARLGGGGMGEVYLARRTGALGFEKLVALKTILPRHKKRSTVEIMFLDEARTAARLNHPTIPQVYDFGQAGRTFYLAMEYVAGVPFDMVADMLGEPWPPAVAARAMVQVCRGLHSAHTLQDLAGRPLGIVHRDVSPHNLLLSFDGRVKLIDFGIALARGRMVPTTDSNELRGKLRYMSPEQLKRKPLDFHADIFSCGVVLYELLVGHRVIRSMPVMGEAALGDGIAPVTRKNPYVLPDLDAVVARALRAQPGDRFGSARQMARALEACSQGADLEGFAEEVLSAARVQHQEWIRDLIDEEAPGDDLPARPAVPLPALPKRVTTSLHRLIDADDPDDTSVEAGEPVSGHTAPRLQPRERPVAVQPTAHERETPAHKPVLIAGGAGLALAVALLLFAVLRSSGPEEPVALPAAVHPEADGSEAQQEIQELRAKLDAVATARGVRIGDDHRFDQAMLLFDHAARLGELDEARAARRMAEDALAAVVINQAFVDRKLNRLRLAYDNVNDPLSLRHLNPIMEQVFHARMGYDLRRMNRLMNQAFAYLDTRSSFRVLEGGGF